MESGALRQLRRSLTTLLWDLYDEPLKCSFMDSYTPMGPEQIAPCNPQPPSYKPWMGGGSCSVSFVSLTFSWDDLFYCIGAKNVIWQKASNFVLHLAPQCLLIVLKGIACDKFSPARLWLRKIAAPLNKISVICKNR